MVMPGLVRQGNVRDSILEQASRITRKQAEVRSDTKALARRTDAPSSLAAAQKMDESGKRDTNRGLAYQAVILYPGRTSKELAALGGLDRHEMARRLADLREHGGAIISIYSDKKKALLWYEATGSTIG